MRTYVRDVMRRLFPKAMHARARSHLKWKEIEEDLLPVVVDPEREAVDVGANVGRYAIALSTLARHVYAFAPDTELAAFLARAAPPNLDVFPEALSDREGPRRFRVPVIDGELAVAVAAIDDDDSAVVADDELRVVHATTLNRLAGRDIGFVKIDVEGHELSVLRGGCELLERRHPVVLVEVEERHEHGGLAAVTEFFTKLDYAGFFVYEDRSRGIDEFSLDLQDPDELAKPVNRRDMLYVNNFFFAQVSSVAELRRRIDDRLRAHSST